ncbi:hypothetical protein GCM10010872_26180 [Dyella flava]|nr:hypothetical protein GCM10010872_26180 [Dyella flava]
MLCLLPVAVQAQNAPQDGQLVPGVINLFTSLNLNLDVLHGAAENLFWGLAIIGLFWSMVVLLFRRADISEFFFEMVSFTLFTGLFYWLLTQASDSSGLISVITNSFKQLGGDLTGQGQGGSDLAVSGNNIINMGLSIFNTAVNQTDGMAPGEQMMLFTVALLVLGALALIGTQVVLVLIMAWMLAYGGIFLLGFGGSRWTSLVAISYYKHAIAVGIALLGLMVIVAFGESALYTSTTRLVGGTAIDMYTLAQMLVLSLIMMVLSIKLPSLLYRMVTGSQLGLLAGTATMTGRAISTGSGAIYSSVYNSATQAFNDYRAHYPSISHERSDQRGHIEGASAVVRTSAVEAIRQATVGVGVGDPVYQSMNMPQYNAVMGRVTPEAVSAADGQSGSVFTHAGDSSQPGFHATSPSAQASPAPQKTNSQVGENSGPATSNTNVLYRAGLASAGTTSGSVAMQESTSRHPMQGGASNAASAASKASGAVATDMTDVRQHGGMAAVGGAGAITSAAGATLGGGFQPNMPAPQTSSGHAAQGSPRTSSDGVSNQQAGVAVAATGAAMAAAGATQSAGAPANMPTSVASPGKPGQGSPGVSMDGASSQKVDATVAATGAVQVGVQPNMPVSADTSQKPVGGFQPNMSALSSSGKSDQGLPRTSPDASTQKASTTVAGAGVAQAGTQPNMPVPAEKSQEAGGGSQPNAPASSSPSGKSDQGLPRTSSDAFTQKASTTVAGTGAAQGGTTQSNMPVTMTSSQRPNQDLLRNAPDTSTQKAVSSTRTLARDDQPSPVVSSRPVKSKFKRRAGKNKIALKREAGKTSSSADPRHPRKDRKPVRDDTKPANSGKPDHAGPTAPAEDEVTSLRDRSSSQSGADADGD